MADWFKMYEGSLSESRMLSMTRKNKLVIGMWVWILEQCCSSKCNTVELHEQSMLEGAEITLNMSSDEINECLELLSKTKYIKRSDDSIKVHGWSKLQSNYCNNLNRKKQQSSTKLHKVPLKGSSSVLEESRSEEKREESTSEKKTKRLDVKCIANVAANKKENLSYQHKLVDAYKLIVKKGITMTVEDWCTLYEYYGTTMDLPLIATDMLARHAVDPIENGYRWCFAIIRNDDTTRYSRPEKPYCPTDAEFARDR